MLTTILSLFGCGQKDNKKTDSSPLTTAEQYVSMDCQAGDITLTLNADNSFELTILFWDDKTKSHNGSETIKGTWTKDQEKLTLKTTDNWTISYKLTTTNIKIGNLEINNVAFGFTSSDKSFFGSNIDLLERGQAEKFFKDAVINK